MLLAACASSSVGIFSSLYLESHRDSFRSTITKALPSKIQKLFFSKEEFNNIQWEEEFSEFEFEGKLFDVSEIRKTSKGFEIYCVNDSEEETIIAFFKECKSNLPVNKSKIQLHPLFIPDSFIEICRQDVSDQIAFCDLAENYNSELLQIPSPPPR